MTDQLHSIRDAAARLAISPWTVRRLANRGELRVVRLGRRLLVSEREIMRVIRHGAGGGESGGGGRR
jgi:excisionase family DNA binding protein